MKTKIKLQLLLFNKNTKKRILAKKNNIIVTNKEDLKIEIMESLNSNENKMIYLGIIPLGAINNIKNSITDIKKEKINTLFEDNVHYSLSIAQSEIRHIKKESISLIELISYIENIQDIILNFDEVRYTIYNNNQNALRFSKKIDNNTYIVLEVISNKLHNFRTHTIFIIKQDYKKKHIPNV